MRMSASISAAVRVWKRLIRERGVVDEDVNPAQFTLGSVETADVSRATSCCVFGACSKLRWPVGRLLIRTAGKSYRVGRRVTAHRLRGTAGAALYLVDWP